MTGGGGGLDSSLSVSDSIEGTSIVCVSMCTLHVYENHTEVRQVIDPR